MSRIVIPVVRRPREGRLEVEIPWRSGGSRGLIMRICGGGTRPAWDRRAGCWLVARAYFLRLVRGLAERYGRVLVITVQCNLTKCDRRCQRARDTECRCSCGGDNHGRAYTRGWQLAGEQVIWGTEWSEWHWVVARDSLAQGRRAA